MERVSSTYQCPKAKLVIELDGSQHYEEDALFYDAQRTDYLNQHEIVVLRYTNREIHTRFKEVCDDIGFQVNERINTLR